MTPLRGYGLLTRPGASPSLRLRCAPGYLMPPLRGSAAFDFSLNRLYKNLHEITSVPYPRAFVPRGSLPRGIFPVRRRERRGARLSTEGRRGRAQNFRGEGGRAGRAED